MSKFSVTPYSKSAEVMPSMMWPMANSTPMETDMSTNNTTTIYNTINYNPITINQASDSSKSHKPPKQTMAWKKPTATNAIKPAEKNQNNQQNGFKSVERILYQINMTKYAHLFKKYDVNRFKELRELDLNAMGITRPQELRTFKDAISKAKYDKY